MYCSVLGSHLNFPAIGPILAVTPSHIDIPNRKAAVLWTTTANMWFDDSLNSDSPYSPARHCCAECGRDTRPQILIVDDCLVNRRVALLMLRQLGYPADVAQDGRDALAAIGRGSYSLVFLDIQMPDMGGLEVARRIRVAQKAGVGGFGPGLRIVACTANVSSEDRAECLAAGMNDFLPKPILPHTLGAMLQKHLLEAAGA